MKTTTIEPVDTATYDGKDLRAQFHYDKGPEDFHLETCQWDAADCVYWAAVNGGACAFRVKRGSTCIASVERMLMIAFNIDPRKRERIYVITRPANRTPSVWNRWTKKWNGRTAQ
jgi:hypothetical protein